MSTQDLEKSQSKPRNVTLNYLRKDSPPQQHGMHTGVKSQHKIQKSRTYYLAIEEYVQITSGLSNFKENGLKIDLAHILVLIPIKKWQSL